MTNAHDDVAHATNDTNDVDVTNARRAKFVAQCNVAIYAMRYMGRKLRDDAHAFVASINDAFDIIDVSLIDDANLRRVVDAHVFVARSNVTHDVRIANVTNTIARMLETHFAIIVANDATTT